MRWAALSRRSPILRGVSASHIRADHAVNQARIPFVQRRFVHFDEKTADSYIGEGDAGQLGGRFRDTGRLPVPYPALERPLRPSLRLIRPISARYGDGLSLRIWARILLSRFERRSRQRRGGPSSRDRRNISMAC
jgi:hypothetical protein